MNLRGQPKLNARQIMLLQRIVDGREPVTSRESALAPSVYALRSRGLVATTWADGAWTARATNAGRLHLECLALDPDPHGSNRHPAGSRAGADAAGRAAALVARVQEAGGSLQFTGLDTDSRATLRGTIQAAIRAGHRLHYTGRLHGDLVITMATPPASRAEPTASARTKTSTTRSFVRRTHPLVAELRTLAAAAANSGTKADPRLPPVSRRVLPRALRLLNLLFIQAESRGHSIRSPPPTANCPHAASVLVHGHAYAIVLVEYGGILTLKLDGVHTGRRVWVDGTRTRLEQKLGDVLACLEERAREAEQRRREREQLAREQEIAREAERSHYRAAYAHDYATGVLREQVEAWQLAEQIRALCTHVQQHIDENTASLGAQQWVDWAREHAEHLDPARRTLTVPAIPEPTTRDLDRYRDTPLPFTLETP